MLLSVPYQGRKLQAENSLSGKFVRRWSFLTRYFRARAQWNTLKRFQPILQKTFEHEWIEGTKVRLRFIPGCEEREFKIPWGNSYLLRLRWMPWRDEGGTPNWNSPIAVTLYKHGKDGGRPQIVRYMALFIHNNILHINQLQGIFMIEMPKGLRDWAERFVQATMEFAKAENFKGVRVSRAQSMYSYQHPTIRSFLAPEVKEKELKRIRSNMETYHNETASNLGFRAQEDWFVWDNPDFKADTRPPAQIE